MKHDKTFDAIAKLKDVEIELHRLKNLLEMTGKALDAKSEWVGLTDEEVQLYSVQHCRMVNTHYDSAQNTNLITEEFDAPAFYKTIEAALRSKNT